MEETFSSHLDGCGSCACGVGGIVVHDNTRKLNKKNYYKQIMLYCFTSYVALLS